MKAEVVPPFVIGVGFTHSIMSRESCSGQQEEDDCQDVEGLPAGDSHLLVLMWEGGRE